MRSIRIGGCGHDCIPSNNLGDENGGSQGTHAACGVRENGGGCGFNQNVITAGAGGRTGGSGGQGIGGAPGG